MRALFILISLIGLMCCENQTKNNKIREGFITESGNYFWFPNKSVIMKDIEGGEKIFAIKDEHNKILYQQSLNELFSDYHSWSLYLDNKENVYIYNGDLQITKALIWISIEKKYREVNFCTTKISLPLEFKKKLSQPSSNFDKCKSLK